jgi:hypothetical protein
MYLKSALYSTLTGVSLYTLYALYKRTVATTTTETVDTTETNYKSLFDKLV